MAVKPRILIIDGMNFLHRSRAGFQGGDYSVVFNFFRSFRALVNQFTPTRVYFCLEGHPEERLEMHGDYKGNREIDPKDEKKLKEMAGFYRQVNLVVEALETCFPISVIRHPNHEADDVIYNMIRKSSSAVEWIIVSNDSDFIQVLHEHENVKIYNPMKKEFVETPEYDYVLWKSLRGDATDNIPGIPGVGDKTAEKYAREPELLKEFFLADPAREEIWTRNYDLIKFFEFSNYELSQVTCSQPVQDWEILRKKFEEWGFKSLLKEDAWQKFVNTFDPLFGLSEENIA